MAVLMISYDLRQPGRSYEPVYSYIKRNYTYCKGMESLWLVDTNRTASQIRDDLSKLVDSNDVIFVAKLSGPWGSWNYTCADWLNSPERSW